MSEETEGTEYTIEARVEWLETAVESLLSSVQVRPSGERPMPPEAPIPKEGEDADSEGVPVRRPRGGTSR